jgi:pimeloyl-ACP methyl ester carboxylesterase
MADIYKSEAGRQAVLALYRRALDRWPVPREELIVPTKTGDTFVVASGNPANPPVVLFHGSGTNSSAWMRDVATWAARYRVFAVDMIGEPGLSAPSRPPFASSAYAEWLDDVWSGLGLSQASVVGLSLGGWLGLDYAVRRPARVAALSLLSPSGVGRQNVSFLLKVGLLRQCGEWGLLRSMQLVTGRRDALPPQLREALLVVFRNFRPRMDRLPLRPDDELASLAMPVQVIVGSDDALLRSSETRERIERNVRKARVLLLEGVGHILPPQTTAVLEFLEATTRRAQGDRVAQATAAAN